jgi:hypothetical protein
MNNTLGEHIKNLKNIMRNPLEHHWEQDENMMGTQGSKIFHPKPNPKPLHPSSSSSSPSYSNFGASL